MLENLHVYNFIMVAINLVILYVVLRKVLFKPVTAFMDKRAQSIQNAIDEADEMKAEAQKLRESYEAQMTRAGKDAEEIIAEATARANRKYDEILAQSKKDADALLSSAREEISREREAARKELVAEVVGLAIGAASKLVEADMNSDMNKKLVRSFLDEEGAA